MTKPMATKNLIKDGNVLLAYGLDEEGLQLICDEAIAAFRALTEPNSFWMSHEGRQKHEEAHEKAITKATEVVSEVLAKRGQNDLEKVWSKYIDAQETIEQLERQIEFGEI